MMDFDIMEESELLLLLEEDKAPPEEDAEPEEEEPSDGTAGATDEEEPPAEEPPAEDEVKTGDEEEPPAEDEEEDSSAEPPVQQEPIDNRKVLNLFDNYVELYNTTRQLSNNVIDLLSAAADDKKESVLKFRNEILLTREQLENVISQKFSDLSYVAFDALYKKFLTRVEELVDEFASKNGTNDGKQTE